MRWLSRDEGQASVEYAMILLLLTTVLVFALAGMVGPARAFFESIPDKLPF